ncbi:hypothetical protein BD770DRAFT_477831 [Pilaira anomala]|nr:hypothetical protein BD770DRAFT_477831 [Pilaira anomala]
MSVFNVFSTEMEKELLQRRYHTTTTTTISSVPAAAAAAAVVVGQSKNGRNNPPLFNRFHYDPSSTASDSFSNSSFYTSSSKNSSFEVIFSRLLDILIFTSAIAITAISYLKGTLRPMVEAPPITNNHNSLPYNQKRHSHSEGSYNKPHDPIEDSKRRRTQEWAEQVLTSTTRSCPTSTNNKKRSCSTTVLIDSKKVQPLSRDNNMKRERKRTQSLPVNKPLEKEDEALLRMEEKLQSLIQQGQDALSSPVGYNDLQ